jgi:hypothetical protein
MTRPDRWLVLAACAAACGGPAVEADGGSDGAGAADAAWPSETLYEEDFEPYAAGSSLAGQGGWVGDDVRVGDRAELGSRAASGQIDTGSAARAVVRHPLPPIDGGVAELTLRAYAYLRQPLTDKAGVFLSDGEIDVGWLASKGAGLAWRFDLRALTGEVEDFEDLFGGYAEPVALALVIDDLRDEAYGRYDFGDGPRTTRRIAIPAGAAARLTSVAIVQDYYDPTDHLGADLDELRVIVHRPR